MNLYYHVKLHVCTVRPYKFYDVCIYIKLAFMEHDTTDIPAALKVTTSFAA